MSRLRRAFGVVSADVARDPKLSMTAKALYLVLCTYADEDGMCYPSNDKLAEDLGCSVSTAQRALVELGDSHAITRQQQFVAGRQVNSVTRLTDAVTTRVVIDDTPGGSTSDTPGGSTSDRQNKTSSNKTSSSTPPTPQGERGEAFERFWKMYPRKDGGKIASRKKWDTVTKTTDPEVILNGLRRQLDFLLCEATREPGKNYVPHPQTWLNQGRWEDEVTTTTARKEIHPR